MNLVIILKKQKGEDIFTLHPSSSKVLINDETQFDNSTIKTIVSAGFDDFNTHQQCRLCIVNFRLKGNAQQPVNVDQKLKL